MLADWLCTGMTGVQESVCTARLDFGRGVGHITRTFANGHHCREDAIKDLQVLVIS